jgi:hypothetical protein
MTVPAMSGQGIRVRGVGGGKFAGQRSSPEQGLHAFTCIRWSVGWEGVGGGEVVRARVLEVAVCWRRVRGWVIMIDCWAIFF